MTYPIHKWPDMNADQQADCLARSADLHSAERMAATSAIIASVRNEGDAALLRYTEQFDGCQMKTMEAVPTLDAEQGISHDLLMAIDDAGGRIKAFQMAARPDDFSLQTAPGMDCEMQYRPLETVGIYIPGGSSPLLSSVLMQAIPARVAGCRQIVLCTPPNTEGEIHPAILAAANYCGIDSVWPLGGVQAIAAMAYGTESIPRCDKIFGPGNAWVTAAKQLVSQDPAGAAIDLPAGPSEVMVIADAEADPEFVALDLLSQAEHGTDSQSILASNEPKLLKAVGTELDKWLEKLPRAEILIQSITLLRLIQTDSIAQAVDIANRYAPEHLILNLADARDQVSSVINAGSIFLGAWTPESLGDYCSGTNHVLPTSGYARSYSGLSVTDFMKRISIQEAAPFGLLNIGKTAEIMARTEALTAHEMAVRIRRERLEAML